jgi:hypothetical protein
VVGKNYRLQDIQLSKIIRGKKSLGSFRSLGIAPPDPSGSLHSRGPFAPLRAARRNFLFYGRLIRSFKPSRAQMPEAFALPMLWRAGALGGVPGEPRMPEAFANEQSGEYRARTGDLLVANQALSQLS